MHARGSATGGGGDELLQNLQASGKRSGSEQACGYLAAWLSMQLTCTCGWALCWGHM